MTRSLSPGRAITSCGSDRAMGPGRPLGAGGADHKVAQLIETAASAVQSAG